MTTNDTVNKYFTRYGKSTCKRAYQLYQDNMLTTKEIAKRFFFSQWKEKNVCDMITAYTMYIKGE
jgi:hypothetical protein